MMTAARKVRWEEMLPDELLEAIGACPVCYVAYGLAEPHGAYNALGLDWLKAYALCERAAEAHGGVVAPPLCWHVQEMPHFDWFGANGVHHPLASSIPADLFLQLVMHQLRVFDARGFHVAIL
jgi:creatinine amidohydrolase/Fe(II)-dependent formamide hydrolase-like protein